jgi:hypothetical protein
VDKWAIATQKNYIAFDCCDRPFVHPCSAAFSTGQSVPKKFSFDSDFSATGKFLKKNYYHMNRMM